MGNVKLREVSGVLDELSYPVTRIDAAQELEEHTLQHAGGEANLGALVSDTIPDTFHSPDDLESELHNVLPQDAVGEAGQSEGEG